MHSCSLPEGPAEQLAECVKRWSDKVSSEH